MLETNHPLTIADNYFRDLLEKIGNLSNKYFEKMQVSETYWPVNNPEAIKAIQSYLFLKVYDRQKERRRVRKRYQKK